MGKLSLKAAGLLEDVYASFEAGEPCFRYDAGQSRAVRELVEAWLIEVDDAGAGRPGTVMAITPYGRKRARELSRGRSR